MQENLQANTLWNGKRRGIKKWLALSAFTWLDAQRKKAYSVIMAERCYAHELPIRLGIPISVLENLPPRPTIESRLVRDNFLLLAGTLGLHYGTLQAIHFLKALGLDDRLVLTGYAPEKKFREEIKNLLPPGIRAASALDKFVPPDEIESKMRAAKVLLLPYQINPATRDRIPTKLYQAIRLNTPVLYTRNPAWERLLLKEPIAFATTWDFSDPTEIARVKAWLKTLGQTGQVYSEQLHLKLETRFDLGLARTELLF